MSILPPTGWYPDPEQPGMLRYWDGAAWTDHRTPDTEPAGPRRIGSWLSVTFSTLGRRVPILLALAGVLVVVPTIPLALALDAWVRDLVVIDGNAEGLDNGALPVVVVTAVVSALASLLFTITAAHQLVWAQRGHRPSWGESVVAGLRTLPRLVGITLALVVLMSGALVALVAVGVPAVSLLGLLGWAVLVVFLVVKASFLPVAAGAAPAGVSLMRASAEASRGRFWQIVGRLLLLAIVTAGVSLGANLATAPASAVIGGFDPGEIELADDGTVERLVMDDLLPSPAAFPISLALSALVQAVSTAVWIAGLSVLYVDVRAPLRSGP